MAQRIVFGNRGGGQYGLFVSKPGHSALTAATADLLLSTIEKNLQFVASGVVSLSSGSAGISWSPLGFRPKVLLNSQHEPSLTYTSDNSATISVSSLQTIVDTYWSTANKPALSSRCEWFVLAPGL